MLFICGRVFYRLVRQLGAAFRAAHVWTHGCQAAVAAAGREAAGTVGTCCGEIQMSYKECTC